MSSRLSDYNFDLPESQIAQSPPEPRDNVRLLVVRKATGEISHHKFTDLPRFFGEDDVVIYNQSLPFPCRLWGYKEKSTSEVEVLLMRELDPEAHLWNAIVEPARKIRVGNKIYFKNSQFSAEVVDNTTSRERALRFIIPPGESFNLFIEEFGEMALPVYIKRPHQPKDYTAYRPVWSGIPGSVQVPDASLPFTKLLIREMEINGTVFVPITLHTGAPNFRGIEVEDLHKFSMDAEYAEVSPETAEQVRAAKRAGKQVLAVGVSVLRAVESHLTAYHELKAGADWTIKFIFPPAKVHVPTALLTQFHRPKSPGYIATAAFAGYLIARKAYETALAEGYQWGCYGDMLLIL
jgi:S-adenosylmethionine:tRNA ribosyltransferase-isomerase